MDPHEESGTHIAQKLIKESEARYRNLINNLEAGVVVHAPDTSVVMNNPRASELLGLSDDQMRGKVAIDPAWKFIHEDNTPLILDEYPVKRIVSCKQPIKNQILGICQPGSDNVVWVTVNGFPVLNDTGDIIEIVISFIDITERKLAETALIKSQENLSITLHSIGDGVISTDINGLIVNMNPVAEKLCGWALAEAGGRPLTEVFRIINVETCETVTNPVKDVLESGEIVGLANHTALISRDGTEYQISDSAAPIKNKSGEIIGVVLVFSDVTENYADQKRIMESENYLRETQIIARLGSYTLDIATGIWSSSEILDEIFGIEKHHDKSVEGWVSIIHPDWQKTMNDYLIHEVVGNKMKFDKEYQIIRKSDHEVRWIHGLGKLEFDDDLKPIRMLGTVQDITERKLAEEKLIESELKYRSLIENSSDAIFCVDDKGEYKFTNTLFASTLGKTPEYFIGKTFWDIYDKEHADFRYEATKRVFLTGQSESVEVDVPLPDKTLYFLAKTNPIKDKSGKVILNLTHASDISELKKVERELQSAKKRAEESDRLKSAFLANMSHEIRTPMNGILGFADLLKEPNLSGDEQQKYIGIIEKSGARMLNIINDIIDISKIESGLVNVDMKESNINEQMEYIYTFFKPEVEAKGMKFIVKNTLPSKAAFIITDREKVYAIITNLVKNAIKFSKEGFIELGYNLVEKQGIASLQFYVKDTGVGIPEERRAAIFQRFVQGDISDTMARQGAGLGLAISKAYAEMLGGNIWVESEEGIGSTFYFSLPYNAKPEEQAVLQKELSLGKSQNQIKNLKILIAEDDEVSEMLIDITVSIFGKVILKARTGVEAVELCRNNPDIDLVLMDIRMPEMGGYEATRLIREFNKNVVIIAQTAYGLSGDREKSIEAGCNDYISKPIVHAELMGLLQKYFGK